jgi:hypothetical protein
MRGIINPLLWFGCAAMGEHAWGKSYIAFDGYRERQCRWCDRVQRGEYIGTRTKRSSR